MKRMTRLLSRAAVLRQASLVLSAAMVGGLLQFAAPPEAMAQGNDRPALPSADKPVPGANSRSVKPRTLSKGPKTPIQDVQTAWPKAATAVLDIPDPAAKTAATKVQAEGLPITLSQTGRAKDAVRGRVEARLLDRKATAQAGVRGVLFALTPQGDAKQGAPARVDSKTDVSVEYARFADAFGGGYGSRLRLAQLPACALTTPDKASCGESTPLKTANDTDEQTLTATAVKLEANQPTVLALTAAAESEKGDYKASPLSPSAAWSANLNTGDFTWSYDMATPEVPGGLSPDVTLSYSSGAIDGRTGGTNNQASWVGDGFDLSPGFIERRYKPCADDGVKNADGRKPGDLCWGYDNAFISFNGMGGELVPAGDNEFKLKKDDGTRVTRLRNTALANGDNDGEYWRVTAPDGTRYYFGYNRPSGWTEGKEETNSSWTVPVFGNNSGEPCHKTTFADSWCQQTWRWNIDAVIDSHGNRMTYYYGKEANSYGRNTKAADDTPYTRGGYLKRIEYGLRNFYDKPQAQVLFDNSERCLPETGVTCAADTINDKKFYWYDTPWDLNCKAGAECDSPRLAPSFWTRKRLTDVTTQVLQTDGTYGKVDSWKLGHRWGMADVDYQLLLDSVQHTGHTASTPITLPKTTFAYTQLENRLDMTGDGFAPFIKARLSTVADESGGQIDANYSASACKEGSLPTPHTNTTRCFPQYIGGDTENDPELQWFNKYVVDSVTATDRTGGAPGQVTRYEYLGGAAWHYDDDDGLIKEKNKTWSQWRGYGHVRVKKGGQGGAATMKSQEDRYFLRGMNDDRKDTTGGKKSVAVTLGDGEGDPITDHSSLSGFAYKSVQYDAPGGKVLGKSVNRPWTHETARKTRSWGTVTADLSGVAATTAWQSLDNGAGAKWRKATSSTKYDTIAGRAIEADDPGDTSTAADDRCTRTTYATNTDANILGLVARAETVAKACGAPVDRSKDVISDVRSAYDGGAYGAAPTKGDPTATATLKDHDGTKATYLEAGATFDAYGRRLTVTDLTADVTATGDATPVRVKRTDGRTTTTSFTPSTGMPRQTVSTTPPTNPADTTTAQKTTSDLDVLRGHVLKETDTNGNTTQFAFDALGRSTKVWLADRNASSVPTYEYAYSTAEGKPVAVATKLLDNNGGQITSYKIYDGFLRERQSQAPGPDGGRLVSDVFYDERGLVGRTNATYFTAGPPVSDLFKPDDALSVESQARIVYDGLARPVKNEEIAGDNDGGKVLGTTTTLYGGDRTTVIPPTGGIATTTLSDYRGNITELRQHHERTADAAYDTTRYEYTPSGQQSKVIDPAGNVWTTSYDQLGRAVEANDPDKGRTTTKYDDHSQVTSSTDARNVTLVNVYDGLGRKTAVREGSSTGKLRLSWTYDTVSGAKGYLAESTRYVGDAKYTNKVTQYDRLYRPARTAVVVPDTEGALAGTYQSATTYRPSGKISSISYSAAGSLPGGAINYGYEDGTLRATSVFGQGITAATNYSHTGKPLQQELGLTEGGKKTWVTNAYERGTQRLDTRRVDRQDQAGVDQYLDYTYDQAGNVLSVADTSRTGTDNQCFTYDYLRRLTEAWTQDTKTCAASPSGSAVKGPAPYWQSFTYDKTGNRLSETRHDTGGEPAKDSRRTYAYPEPGKAKAHTLTSVTTEGAGGPGTTAYAYDEAGNTTRRGSQVLDWDAEGRLSKVTEGSKATEYLYDADGERLITRTGSQTTLSLGHTEVTLDKGAAKAKATRYFDLGDGNLAVRNDDGSFAFTIGDHHGTGVLAVGATDLALTQRRVLPFGGVRGQAPAAWPGTKGFVGGTDDAKDTGLVHLGAREYDPDTGRFISVDPVMDTSDAQQMNGYTYGNNSPVVNSDPDGRFFGWIFKLIENVKNAFKIKNPNPNKNLPRATAPKVDNTDLRKALKNIYAKPAAKTVVGDGKSATAIIEEFNTGDHLPGKDEWHVKKGWNSLSNLSTILERDRRAREDGKGMQHLLSDSDLKVAKAEARELWVAVNSRDVTGKIDKVIEGDPIMKAEMKKNFNGVMKSASMSHLTGRKFEPVEHRAPRPVGEPTRLRGYARGFGIAGGVLSVAQAPSYATQYGMKRGAWELFKDVVDPFGVSDGSNPPVSNVCQLGVNCA
ncbi:RHS repeat-associated core domain-containing protein [Streptomyces albidoflavus]